MKKKPYIDCEFVGVHPFTRSLEKVHISYETIQLADIEELYKKAGDLFNREDDSLVTGKCIKDNKEVFFADLGIKITPSFNSHVVFIFDHLPGNDELLTCIHDMENIVMQRLDSFDPGILSSADKTCQ